MTLLPRGEILLLPMELNGLWGERQIYCSYRQIKMSLLEFLMLVGTGLNNFNRHDFKIIFKGPFQSKPSNDFTISVFLLNRVLTPDWHIPLNFS